MKHDCFYFSVCQNAHKRKFEGALKLSFECGFTYVCFILTFLYVKRYTNKSLRVSSNFRLSMFLHTFAAFLLFCMSKHKQTKL